MLLLSVPYALKLRMPNSRGAAGIRLFCWMAVIAISPATRNRTAIAASPQPESTAPVPPMAAPATQLSKFDANQTMSQQMPSVSSSAAHRVFQLPSIFQ